MEPDPRWLVFIHLLPPKPDYLRVKVRRRLAHLGALALKNTVYLLPRNDDTLEDFQWLRREIVEDGGHAMILEASFLDGMGPDDIEGRFVAAREAEYGDLRLAIRDVTANPRPQDVARLRRQMADIVKRDFFVTPGRGEAEGALDDLDRQVRGPQGPPERVRLPPDGATWVTRRGVKVDRIASAWLIRRFLDPHARFRFVEDRGYEHVAGELRFDMFEGEYSHHGDRCTFEVLLASFGLHDAGLVALGEIVHDIDLKDGKFGRDATGGVAAVLQGIALHHEGDEGRLEAGAMILDSLYVHFSAQAT